MAQMSSVPSSMTRPRAADATLFWDMITSPSGRSNKEASEQRVILIHRMSVRSLLVTHTPCRAALCEWVRTPPTQAEAQPVRRQLPTALVRLEL